MDFTLKRFKRCFNIIPKDDRRAKIGPRDFVIALLFYFLHSRGEQTLASIRLNVMATTGKKLARSSFWERIATKRLFMLLLGLVEEIIRQTCEMTFGCGMQSLLAALNVTGILVLDSSSITLPKMAGAVFPGPRKNVAPAVIKWHNCFDLFGGSMKWFDISPGTSHDHNHFPDLAILVGKLIIFDLGYFDFCTLQAIANIGGFFLCRIKMNTLVQVEKVIEGLPKNFQGKMLFSKQLPKGKGLIEVMGLFQDGLFQFRVIGFWNPVEKRYHWYVTNLTVAAKLIYSLYRLRWQVELLFKMAKGSLRAGDITSADPNIVQTLLLASIAVTAMSYPLAFKLAMFNQKNEKELRVPSVQRSGHVIVRVAAELREFLMSSGQHGLGKLKKKLQLFEQELFDPNRKRETSIQRAINIVTQMA